MVQNEAQLTQFERAIKPNLLTKLTVADQCNFGNF